MKYLSPQGPPGTGKTRLIRAILAEISRRKGEQAKSYSLAEVYQALR
jgi:DNA replication protein DnaC